MLKWKKDLHRRKILKEGEKYNCRTVEDWINLGMIDGTHYPLPATVFVPRFRSEDEMFSLEDDQLNKLFAWTNAAVTHYDRERKLWTVLTLDGRKREFKIPRVYIRLFAEDPRIYAKRVAAAIKHRRIAEASIKCWEVLRFLLKILHFQLYTKYLSEPWILLTLLNMLT